MVRCGGGEVSPPPVLLCPQCPWAGSSQVFLIPPLPRPPVRWDRREGLEAGTPLPQGGGAG